MDLSALKLVLPLIQQVVGGLDDPAFIRAFFAYLASQAPTIAGAASSLSLKTAVMRMLQRRMGGQPEETPADAQTVESFGATIVPVLMGAAMAGLAAKGGKV